MIYKNKSGRSGVSEYEETPEGLMVRFKSNGKSYFYPIETNGHYMISRMVAMARNGEYLNRLINAEHPQFDGDMGDNPVAKIPLRSNDERDMINIHNKFVWRTPSIQAAVKAAQEKKTRSANSYSDFKKARGKKW